MDDAGGRVDLDELENVIKQALPMTMRNESPCEARVALRALLAEVRAHREREASVPSALRALTWLEWAGRNDGPPTLHINKQLLRQQLEPIRAFLEPLPAPPAVKEPT